MGQMTLLICLMGSQPVLFQINQSMWKERIGNKSLHLQMQLVASLYGISMPSPFAILMAHGTRPMPRSFCKTRSHRGKTSMAFNSAMSPDIGGPVTTQTDLGVTSWPTMSLH